MNGRVQHEDHQRGDRKRVTQRWRPLRSPQLRKDICERCGAHERLRDGLCRQCRRLLRGEDEEFRAPQKQAPPHEAPRIALRNPPWRRRGA